MGVNLRLAHTTHTLHTHYTHTHTHTHRHGHMSKHTQPDTHPFTFPTAPCEVCACGGVSGISDYPSSCLCMNVCVCVCVCVCDIRLLHNRWNRLCVICDWVKYHIFSLKSVINQPPPPSLFQRSHSGLKVMSALPSQFWIQNIKYNPVYCFIVIFG